MYSRYVIYLIRAWIALFAFNSNANQNMPNSEGYIEVRQGHLFYKKLGLGKIPIIILHGDPRLGHSYLLPHMLSLAQKYEIIFYDQRGSGKSQDTEISPQFINTYQFVDDLEVLRKQLRIEKFVLLSHSLGGPLALTYSLKYPERVAALILLNTTPVSDKGQEAFEETFNKRIASIKSKNHPLNNLKEFQELTKEQIYKLYQSIIPLLFYNPSNASQLTLDINKKSAKNGDKVIKLMSKSLRPLNHLLSQLKRLNVPTLIIHSDHDTIPLWTAKELKESIPNAQLIVLTESDHFPYIEKPKQLFIAIYQFLSNKVGV